MCDAAGFWSVSHPTFMSVLPFSPTEGVSLRGLITQGQNQSLPGHSPHLHIRFWMTHLLLRNVPVMRTCQAGPMCKLSPLPEALILLQCFPSEHLALLLCIRNSTGSRVDVILTFPSTRCSEMSNLCRGWDTNRVSSA